MIYINGKTIARIVINGKAVQKIYRGAKLIYTALRRIISCFATGVWRKEEPWTSERPWKGG